MCELMGNVSFANEEGREKGSQQQKWPQVMGSGNGQKVMGNGNG